jgi:hypothetical protein
MNNRILSIAILLFALQSCIAPRSVINSGKVTPKGNFAVGIQYSANVSTAPLNSVKNVVKDNIDKIPALLDNPSSDTVALSADSIQWLNDNLENIGQGAIAYAADPIGVGLEYYIRYGVIDRLDVGYKFAGKAHTFDVQYQFMGSPGNVDDLVSDRWYGSIGLQYSGQKISIPTWLTPIQNTIDFDFKRRDVMVPVIFSRSFGNEEEYGSISLGLVMNYTRLDYSTFNTDFASYIDENGQVDVVKIKAINNTQNIFAYGGFINMKLGYKYFYVLPSLAVYYQNYGSFQNIIGPNFQLKGLTFVPTIGLRARIGKSSRQ